MLAQKGLYFRGETFRAKPAEGISTNVKFSLKDQAVTIFPTIAPSSYISVVHIQNKKIIHWLEVAQVHGSLGSKCER